MSPDRLWLPLTSHHGSPGPAGGIPNGSLSPCTISIGTVTASSSGSRDFSGRPGGCSGNARHKTATAPVSAAVRQATRAPDRPPADDQPAAVSLRRAAATTALHAASSWRRRRVRLPATRRAARRARRGCPPPAPRRSRRPGRGRRHRRRRRGRGPARRSCRACRDVGSGRPVRSLDLERRSQPGGYGSR